MQRNTLVCIYFNCLEKSNQYILQNFAFRMFYGINKVITVWEVVYIKMSKSFSVALRLQFACFGIVSHFSRAPWQINAISLIRPVFRSPTEALPPLVFIFKSWAYHSPYKRPIHTHQCKHCEPASGLRFRYAVGDVFLCTSYLYSSTSCRTPWS